MKKFQKWGKTHRLCPGPIGCNFKWVWNYSPFLLRCLFLFHSSSMWGRTCPTQACIIYCYHWKGHPLQMIAHFSKTLRFRVVWPSPGEAQQCFTETTETLERLSLGSRIMPQDYYKIYKRNQYFGSDSNMRQHHQLKSSLTLTECYFTFNLGICCLHA